MSQKDEQLFNVIAKMAERRLDEFNAQDLANTAWAFVTVGQSNGSLFVTLASAAERCMGDFKPQALGNTIWAFATAGQ